MVRQKEGYLLLCVEPWNTGVDYHESLIPDMAVDTLCWPKFLYWCVGCRKPLHTSLAGKSCTSDVWIPNETRQIMGYATKPSLDGKPDSPPLAGGEWLGSRPPAKLAYWPNKCGRFNLDESTQKPSKPAWMCFNPVLSTTFPWHSSPKKLAAWKVAFAMANTTEHEAWRGFWFPSVNRAQGVL